jgi:prolyl oligopeptidase
VFARKEARWRRVDATSGFVSRRAVIFLTGDNDPRVDPMQSRKMTARLQASGTKRPVLLRTTAEAGHGMGTARNERFAQLADAYSFLMAELK